MLIYNTTYHCEKSCYDLFIKWVRSHYIPTALSCNGVQSPRIARICGGDDNEGISVSVQFDTPHLDALSSWYEKCGAALIQELEAKFDKQVAGFSTIMEQIEL